MIRKNIETADDGKIAFAALVENKMLLGVDDPDLSESDTRARLIDPIFTEALGWAPTQIFREVPVVDGFADYSFGSDFKWFHVEAKRTSPRFKLHIPSKTRRLKLSGAHLLGNRAVKPLIEQAAKYSFTLGTEFAILTNGTQFIIFQSLTRGRTWTDGYALVFHDHQDILDNFAEFWELLAQRNVMSGSLTGIFAHATAITAPVYTPLQYVHNPEAELIRNPFWNKISQAFSPILIDQPENDLLQREIIEHCYVSSPLAGESRDDLSRLLRDIMPKFLEDANVKHLHPNAHGAGSFRTRIIDDLKLSKPGTYILTGGVGSGKTTFLRRFAFVDKHAFIRDFCVWLHIDFLEFGAQDVSNLADKIEEYTYKRILATLKAEYARYVPNDGEGYRKLFQPEIEDLGKTALHEVDAESPTYRDHVNRRVSELAGEIPTFVNAVLRSVRKSGKCIVFVLDNTDQQGEEFQRAVFLFSQKLSDNFSTLSIVSLREEKFFAAYRQGAFDAYGSRKFHIGSPDLIEVIRKRLEYGIQRYKKQSVDQSISKSEVSQTETVLRALVTSSTARNGNIMRFLASVSSGDMRLALRMFRDFMSSGNTDVKKIQRIISKGRGPYMMPFHEFAKSAILGSRRYFKGSVTRIVNVFAPSTVAGASHWTACRVLARLHSSQKAYSDHGEGFIQTATVLREYRESFGTSADFVETCQRLMKAGLIESEPPRASLLDQTDAVRISAAGAYYWTFLVRSFAYFDLVFVDTPLLDEKLAKSLAAAAEQRKEDHGLKVFTAHRINRVLRFLSYLEEVEAEEMAGAAQQSGPYRELLSGRIRKQLEEEIEGIKKRTRLTENPPSA